MKQHFETEEYTIGQLENNRFHLLDNQDDNNPEVEHTLINENKKTTMDVNRDATVTNSHRSTVTL